MFDFYLLERETRKGGEDFPAEYASIDPDGRLTVSEDASDFFGPEGVTGMDASVRRSGIVLHGILSGVKSPEDLPGAVEDALSNGSLDSAHAEEALQLLSKRIAAHPEFFDGAGYNEAAVYDRDGSEYRPDRVVIKGGSATVIDYKFGTHEDRYARQVGRYMRLYRAMGYSEVKGYIWYVPEDELVPVQ